MSQAFYVSDLLDKILIKSNLQVITVKKILESLQENDTEDYNDSDDSYYDIATKLDENYIYTDHKLQQEKLGKVIKKNNKIINARHIRKHKRVPKYIINKSSLTEREQKSILSKRAWKNRTKSNNYWRDQKNILKIDN